MIILETEWLKNYFLILQDFPNPKIPSRGFENFETIMKILFQNYEKFWKILYLINKYFGTRLSPLNKDYFIEHSERPIRGCIFITMRDQMKMHLKSRHFREPRKSFCQEKYFNVVLTVAWYFNSNSRDFVIRYCGPRYDW